jgi:hypothetical protein
MTNLRKSNGVKLFTNHKKISYCKKLLVLEACISQFYETSYLKISVVGSAMNKI